MTRVTRFDVLDMAVVIEDQADALEALQARVVDLEAGNKTLKNRLAWTTFGTCIDGPLKGLCVTTGGDGKFFDVHRPNDKGQTFQNSCRYVYQQIGTHAPRDEWQCGEEAKADTKDTTIAKLREALEKERAAKPSSYCAACNGDGGEIRGDRGWMACDACGGKGY